MGCNKFQGKGFDAFLMSQMWDCQEDRERILLECRHQVATTDMLTAALPTLERANLDADFVEAPAELYPTLPANDNSIQNGETVDGITDGRMSQNLQWKCQYENVLIQPPRAMLDIRQSGASHCWSISIDTAHAEHNEIHSEAKILPILSGGATI